MSRAHQWTPFLLLNLLSELDYFLDVGANYGYWSLVASSENIGSKKVIAVEPLKKSFGMCKRNCKLNKSRFDLINKAVSNSRKKRHLFIDKHSISAVGSTLKKPMNDSLSKVLVETITIDDLLHKYSKFKYFVKGLKASENINAVKRETLFIGLCEAVHPKDAELLINMINQLIFK